MLGTLRVRLTTALERAGAVSKISDIAKILARYVCRLIGARVFRHEIRSILDGYDNTQRDVLDLKEDLDNSVKKNRLFRAIHRLSKSVFFSTCDVVAAATAYSVDGDDVYLLYNALSDDDIAEVSGFVLSDRGYSDEEVLNILKETSKLARRLVHRKLGFILTHDPMFESAEDLVGQLHVAVLRVIREYEVHCTTIEHMTARVAKSLKNQAVNLAEKHGREKRQMVGRVRERSPHRKVYHLDISTSTVTLVLAFADRRFRQYRDGNVLMAVRNADTKMWVIVHHKRLYETEQEAQDALALYAKGERSKRERYINPAPEEIDDFQLNVLSIDVMDARTGVRPFSEVCPSEEHPSSMEDSLHEEAILDTVGPRSRPFVELILDSAVDDLFDAWCEEHGYNAATFDLAKMGRMACRYFGVSKGQLRSDLAKTPASMWSSPQIELISEGVSSKTDEN